MKNIEWHFLIRELEACFQQVRHPVRRKGAIVSTNGMSLGVSYGDIDPLGSSKKEEEERLFTQRFLKSLKSRKHPFEAASGCL